MKQLHPCNLDGDRFRESMMQTIIKKWGNTPALKINTSLMKLANLRLEQRINIQVVNGALVITPLVLKEYSLESLVEMITPSNLHGERYIKQPVGREFF